MTRVLPGKLLFSLFLMVVHFWGIDSAAVETRPREVFFRTGFVTGMFQGKNVSNGTFTSDISLQVEVFDFITARQAIVVRALLSNESGLGQARYFGAGGGQRFFSDALMADSQEGQTQVSVRPTWSYYFGWDVNLSQFLVTPLSDTVGAYATMLDAGGTVGVRKVFNEKYAADAMLGYSYGYSVASTLSVTANIVRALFGFSYSF